jgi:protein-disulfide isomerase
MTSPRTNSTRVVRASLAACGVLAVVMTNWQMPLAQQTPPAALVLESAMPDAGSETLTIAGAGFGLTPFVTLDLVPLDVRLAIDARIVAVVPVAAIPPGRYLLTVSRGPGVGDSASLSVSIGADPAHASGDVRAADQPVATSTAPLLASPVPDSAALTSEPAPSPGPAEVAATVGDRTITVADVDREWQRTDPAGYAALMRELYDRRRRAANDLVTNELIAREAAARGTTTEALLREEIPKRTIRLPDAAVTSLYLSLGNRARGASLDQMRPALRAWLERTTEPELAKMSYVEELMKVSARADIVLAAPRLRIDVTPRDPALGPASAPIEMVVFGDLQSTDYVRLAASLPRVRETFGDRVRIVFKALPLFGDQSSMAVQAAACAHAQGRFWAYHDAAVKPGSLDPSRLTALAADAGLDRRAFDRCIDDGVYRDLPRQAVQEAERYGIKRGPSIVVNGRLAPDAPPFLPPFEFFKRLVEEELQRQAKDALTPAR